MKQVCLILPMAALYLATTVKAQEKENFYVPQNVVLKAPADYAQYESSVIDAAKWLEDTNLDEESEKRNETNTFIILWLRGNPTITVEVSQQLATLYGKNVELLSIYMAGYTRNFLENKTSATKFTATKAGVISMLKVYKKRIDVKKTPEMEKLVTYTDGQLNEYIVNRLKVKQE